MARDDEPFVLDVSLPHPSGAVWRALTEKALVDRYYLAPLFADVAGAGTAMAYGFTDEAMITGTVLAFDAPRLFEHTFRFEGDTESPDTVVTYALTEAADGTHLRISHRGYPECSQGYADIAGGWPVIAERLAEVLGATP